MKFTIFYFLLLYIALLGCAGRKTMSPVALPANSAYTFILPAGIDTPLLTVSKFRINGLSKTNARKFRKATGLERGQYMTMETIREYFDTEIVGKWNNKSCPLLSVEAVTDSTQISDDRSTVVYLVFTFGKKR